jgi:hypothetical protein
MLFNVWFTLPFIILLAIEYTISLCVGAQRITITHVNPVDHETEVCVWDTLEDDKI